jgi:molybdopterin-containing oxidoreductase family membrane subunit
VGCFIGSFGLFFTMMCLFIRFLPAVAMAEVKATLPQASVHHHPSADHAEEGAH